MQENTKNSVLEEAEKSFEREMVKRVINRDREAFFQLVKMYDSRIFSIIYRIIGNRDDALEASQDVFLLVYRKIKQYKGEVPLFFWIRKIAVNTALNKIRTFRSDPVRRSGSIDEMEEQKTEKAPFERLEEAEKSKMVRNALMKVPEIYRVPVILKDLENYSYEEMAKTLRTNIGTIKSRLSRGRNELKNILFRIKNEVNEYEMQ